MGLERLTYFMQEELCSWSSVKILLWELCVMENLPGGRDLQKCYSRCFKFNLSGSEGVAVQLYSTTVSTFTRRQIKADESG